MCACVFVCMCVCVYLCHTDIFRNDQLVSVRLGTKIFPLSTKTVLLFFYLGQPFLLHQLQNRYQFTIKTTHCNFNNNDKRNYK